MKPLDEADELAILSTLVKQLRESIDNVPRGRTRGIGGEGRSGVEADRKLPSRRAHGRLDRRRDRGRDCRDGRDVRQADGHGDEGRAGQAGRQARGWQSGERQGARKAGVRWAPVDRTL